MMTFSIGRLVPKFIMEDRNGCALAKATEKALEILCETAQTGVDTVLDVEKMPEWRLDEMAWELGCLYDYTAVIEDKRKWIRNATPLYALRGTPQAIYDYIPSSFDIIMEEAWQYDGDPFHFRITVFSEWSAQKETWLHKAVEQAKNARSVLDDIAVGVGGVNVIAVSALGGILTRLAYPLAGDDILAGMLPE